jgi:hypothetical protein
VLRAALSLLVLLAAPAGAQTGAEAFARGCGGGCHETDRRVLRAIPRGTEAERRAWIAAFMARHPCHCDDAKPAILDWLTERTAR